MVERSVVLFELSNCEISKTKILRKPTDKGDACRNYPCGESEKLCGELKRP